MASSWTYYSEYQKLSSAKNKLEEAKKVLKDYQDPNRALIYALDSYVKIDNKYYDKDRIDLTYNNLKDAISYVQSEMNTAYNYYLQAKAREEAEAAAAAANR